jgi:hypothetical protein
MRRIVLGIAVAFIGTWAPPGASGDCPDPWPNHGTPTALFYLDQIRDIATAHQNDLSCLPGSQCALDWGAVVNVQDLWRQPHATGCTDPKLLNAATAYPYVEAAWKAVTKGKVAVTSIAAAATSNPALSDFTGTTGNFASFSAGMWVVTNGFSTAANNGVWQVSSVSANHDILTVHDGGGAIQDEANAPAHEVWFVPLPAPVVTVAPARSAQGVAATSQLIRQSGTFSAADGFVVGMFVRVKGFGAPVDGRAWEIVAIPNPTTLTVRDPGDLIGNTSYATPAREIIIDPPLACFDTLDHLD